MPARESERARHRELPMRAEQEVAAGSQRLPQGPHESFAELQPLEARLARIEGGVGAGGIELDRGKALPKVFQRPLRRRMRRRIDGAIRIGVRAGLVRIEIGVAAQPLVDLAAEEVVDGLHDRLADDVPQRHLDPAEDAHQRGVGTGGVAAAVDVAPQGLDAERIGVEHVPLEHVADHRHDRLGREARRIDLADALDSAGRPELQKDKIASAESGWRVAHHEGLQIGDLHAAPPLLEHDDVPQRRAGARGGEGLVDRSSG